MPWTGLTWGRETLVTKLGSRDPGKSTFLWREQGDRRGRGQGQEKAKVGADAEATGWRHTGKGGGEDQRGSKHAREGSQGREACPKQ